MIDMLKGVWDPSVKVEENHYYWRGDFKIFKREQKVTDKPKVIELFSGYGGTSLGFVMAGFDVVLGADIHQPSVETFFKNHKNSWSILDIQPI